MCAFDASGVCVLDAHQMRTTIDVPEHLLDEVQRATEASTRKEALLIVLEDYLSRHRLRRVIEAAGTLDIDVDVRTERRLGNRRTDG